MSISPYVASTRGPSAGSASGLGWNYGRITREGAGSRLQGSRKPRVEIRAGGFGEGLPKRTNSRALFSAYLAVG